MGKIQTITNQPESLPKKVYSGKRLPALHGNPEMRIVRVNEEYLDSVLLDVSEYGLENVFDWYCRGTRETNLAVSILFDFLDGGEFPDMLIKRFKADFVYLLNRESWQIDSNQISLWMQFVAESYKETHAE